MKIHNCEQRTPEWFAARAGRFTGSELGLSLFEEPKIRLTIPEISAELKRLGIEHNAKAKKEVLESLLPNPDSYKTESELTKSARFTLICKKIGELAGDTEEIFPTAEMKRGIALEPIARAEYARLTGLDVEEVGFVSHDTLPLGCSPDGVVFGEGGRIMGGVEIKCVNPGKHVRYLLEGVLPDEYKAQVHDALYITGADWWDLFLFCPRATFIKTRDSWTVDEWEPGAIPPFRLRVYPDGFTEQLGRGLEKLCAEYKATLAAMSAKLQESRKEAA